MLDLHVPPSSAARQRMGDVSFVWKSGYFPPVCSPPFFPGVPA